MPLQGLEPRAHRRRAASWPTQGRRSDRQWRPNEPSWALVPFSACGTGDPLNAGFAKPATFRPQRFARSRRLTPPGTSRAYFVPVTLMGFHFSDLQGLRSFRRAGPLSGPFPPMPLVTGATTRKGSGRSDSAPEDYSLRKAGPTNGSLNPDEGRSPPGLFPSRALSSSAVGSASRPFLSSASPSQAVRRGTAGGSEFQRAEDPASPFA